MFRFLSIKYFSCVMFAFASFAIQSQIVLAQNASATILTLTGGYLFVDGDTISTSFVIELDNTQEPMPTEFALNFEWINDDFTEFTSSWDFKTVPGRGSGQWSGLAELDTPVPGVGGWTCYVRVGINIYPPPGQEGPPFFFETDWKCAGFLPKY